MMQASWCIELPYKRYISGTTANDFNSYSRILRKKEKCQKVSAWQRHIGYGPASGQRMEHEHGLHKA
jgi:hypothetical protein